VPRGLSRRKRGQLSLPESMGIKRGGKLLHGLVIGVISGWRWKTMTWPGCGTHTLAREREKEGTDSGSSSWAAGYFSYWAESFPRVHFYFYFFFSLFLFLFSYFLYRFCKTPSNQINQKSKIFSYSKQCSKPVRNMFSR
jgi:hypothetical protein